MQNLLTDSSDDSELAFSARKRKKPAPLTHATAFNEDAYKNENNDLLSFEFYKPTLPTIASPLALTAAALEHAQRMLNEANALCAKYVRHKLTLDDDAAAYNSNAASLPKAKVTTTLVLPRSSSSDAHNAEMHAILADAAKRLNALALKARRATLSDIEQQILNIPCTLNELIMADVNTLLEAKSPINGKAARAQLHIIRDHVKEEVNKLITNNIECRLRFEYFKKSEAIAAKLLAETRAKSIDSAKAVGMLVEHSVDSLATRIEQLEQSKHGKPSARPNSAKQARSSSKPTPNKSTSKPRAAQSKNKMKPKAKAPKAIANKTTTTAKSGNGAAPAKNKVTGARAGAANPRTRK